MKETYTIEDSLQDDFSAFNPRALVLKMKNYLSQLGYGLGNEYGNPTIGPNTQNAITNFVSKQSNKPSPIPNSEPTEVSLFRNVFKAKNYVFQEDGKLNIIGIRNRDTLGSDLFDDELYLIWKAANGWCVKHYPITTDPGKRYYGQRMVNPKGTAILKAGQYRNVYKIGLHKNTYTALVQRNGPVTVYRDNNQNGILEIIPGNTDTGFFGINLHKAGTNSTYVGGWSAGCQVFKKEADFNEFLAICKSLESANNGKFTYTLLEKSNNQIR